MGRGYQLIHLRDLPTRSAGDPESKVQFEPHIVYFPINFQKFQISMGPGGSIQATHMVDFPINLGKSKSAGAYVPGGRGFGEGLVR